MTQIVVAPVVPAHVDAISYPEREKMITEILALADHGHLDRATLERWCDSKLWLIYRGRVLGVGIGMVAPKRKRVDA